MMYNFNMKYRKIFAAIMIFTYVFIISASLFHFHNFNLFIRSSYIHSNTNNNKNYSDLIVTGIIVCTVQQFIQTGINLADNFRHTNSLIPIDTTIKLENKHHKNFQIAEYSYLRAPPLA